MKYLRKYCLVLVMFMLLVLCNTSYAADALYRFMHNDHDALIIGEITHIDENDAGIADIRVVKMITAIKNLDESNPRKQLKLSQASVILPFEYTGFNDADGCNTLKPSEGDYVLLSLNKVGRNFEIAWGAYKVNSLDYKNLSVVLPENPEVWPKMEAAAIKVFINSDGQIAEFAFDGSSKTVYAGEENVVIFSEDTDDSKDAHKNENQIREPSSSSTGIIGGADGPTSIYVTENPLKAMITPAVVLAIVIFAGGFALGYIFKARR